MAGVYTVKQVNSYIKNMFKQDFLLNSVSVKGEISNCKYHTSGHIYFTLKDADAALSVIMFASQAAKLAFKLKDGMSVVVSGRVDVFDAAGKYQLYANTVQQEGIGELYQKFEQLKQYYEDMGYFAKEYKRPLPAFTKKLGVVTSKTGAAVQDIMNISKRRNPYIQIVLYPAYVQGEHAKQSIVSGITRLDKMGLDCIIVGRGGGSIEDLWAFNEPEVVEAVFNASTPVISAVGHETDFTLTDFVADMRAPTPTGAAELSVPQRQDIINYLNQLNIRLNKVMQHKISLYKQKLDEINNRYIFKNPVAIYQTKEMNFDSLIERLKFSTVNLVNLRQQQYRRIRESYILKNPLKILDNKSQKYLQLLSKLEPLSPLLTLERGYTITKKEDKAVNFVSDVGKGDHITTQLRDGAVISIVEEVCKN